MIATTVATMKTGPFAGAARTAAQSTATTAETSVSAKTTARCHVPNVTVDGKHNTPPRHARKERAATPPFFPAIIPRHD